MHCPIWRCSIRISTYDIVLWMGDGFVFAGPSVHVRLKALNPYVLASPESPPPFLGSPPDHLGSQLASVRSLPTSTA